MEKTSHHFKRGCRRYKKLNAQPQTEVFIITNQSGVAIADARFAKLDEKRMHEVNQYIIELLARQGAKIRGYFACPFVDMKYAEKVKLKGWRVHQKYIQDRHPDLKPNIGMLKKCAETLGFSLNKLDLYVIGDRSSDIKLGLNGGGTGILVTSPKTIELGDLDEVKKLQEKNHNRVFIAESFLEAVNFVIRDKRN